jgi:hypothetical protein
MPAPNTSPLLAVTGRRGLRRHRAPCHNVHTDMAAWTGCRHTANGNAQSIPVSTMRCRGVSSVPPVAGPVSSPAGAAGGGTRQARVRHASGTRQARVWHASGTRQARVRRSRPRALTARPGGSRRAARQSGVHPGPRGRHPPHEREASAERPATLALAAGSDCAAAVAWVSTTWYVSSGYSCAG